MEWWSGTGTSYGRMERSDEPGSEWMWKTSLQPRCKKPHVNLPIVLL